MALLELMAEAIKEDRKNLEETRKIQKILSETVGEEILPGIQADIFDVARETRSAALQSAEVFASLNTAITKLEPEIARDQGDVLQLTKSINQALKLSNSSAQDIERAIADLEAGLAFDDFDVGRLANIDQAAPRLAEAIANGLGLSTIQELVNHIEEAGVDAEEVLTALEAQESVLEREFEQLERTRADDRILRNNAKIERNRDSAEETFFDRILKQFDRDQADRAEEITEQLTTSADEIREEIHDLGGLIVDADAAIASVRERAGIAEKIAEENGLRFDASGFDREFRVFQEFRDLLMKLREERLQELRRFEDSSSRPVGPQSSTGGQAPLILAAGRGGGASTPPFVPQTTLGRGSVDFPGMIDGRFVTGLAAGGGESTGPFPMTTDAIEKLFTDIEDIIDNISNITLEKLGDALDENLTDGLKGAGEVGAEALEKIDTLLKGVGDRAVDRLADEIVNLSLDIDSLKEIGRLALDELRAGFEEIARTSLKELLDVLKDVIAQFLRVILLGEQLPSGQGGGDTKSSLLQTAIGAGLSALASSFGGSSAGAGTSGLLGNSLGGANFAEGGTIPTGQFGFVGEEGPELAISRPSGAQIIPLRPPVLSSLSGRSNAAPNVNITQNFDFRRADNGSVVQLRQESERIKRETVAEVAHQAQQGGSFAKAIGKI